MAVPLIRLPRDDPQEADFAIAADQDGRPRRLRRAWLTGRAVQRIIRSVAVHRPALPDRADQADAFLEPVHPLLHRGEPDAVSGMFRLVPARAHPEDEAPARKRVHGSSHPREQGRVPEGHRADQRSKPDSGGALGQHDKRRPGLEGCPLDAPHDAEEVVGAPQRVEPESLDPLRDPEPSVPGQPLLTFDHDADPHNRDGNGSLRNPGERVPKGMKRFPRGVPRLTWVKGGRRLPGNPPKGIRNLCGAPTVLQK